MTTKTLKIGMVGIGGGVWGMATLEVCLAIMQSARDRNEIILTHQVAVPPEYDADLQVPYLEGV